MIRPIALRAANGFVAKHHRHHQPVRGCKFSLGAWHEGVMVGVVIVGRPVARTYDPTTTAEVTRLCTDGTRNACSALYSAAARTCREMGYERIQTYILDSEPGTSLRASGWQDEGEAGGGQWDHSRATQLLLTGGTRRNDQPTARKRRWAKRLAPASEPKAGAPRATRGTSEGQR